MTPPEFVRLTTDQGRCTLYLRSSTIIRVLSSGTGLVFKATVTTDGDEALTFYVDQSPEEVMALLYPQPPAPPRLNPHLAAILNRHPTPTVEHASTREVDGTHE